MNTAEYLLEYVQNDRLALVAKEGQYTYGDILQASMRLAGELLALGVRPGDRVGILGQNSLFWVGMYLATLKVGATAVPFSTTVTPEDVRRNQEFVGCAVVGIEKRHYRKFAPAFDEGFPLLFDNLLNQPGPSAWPTISMQADDLAALMFTSGTTARPRAVRVTHRNIQANSDSIIEYLELNAAECIMAILPFYYCFGTSLLHTHLRVGGSLALSNTFMYPETTLDMMEAAECTGFAGVPSSFQTLLRNSTFPKRELKSLRKIQQAGGKLHSVLIKELVETKPDARVYVMYGQTEATARLSYLPPEKLATKLGSIGQGIPGVSLRVINDGGEPVKPGEVGEIIACGDNICPGYLQDYEASAEKFINSELHTGDLATVDEEGYIFVVDRKADFIKSFGFRVSSQEVETCVLGIPEIVSAAAVGVPDLVAGEAIYVFITVRSGATVSEETIIQHCGERLARHMVPQAVRVIKQMPLNAHGKVVKTELRKLAAQE